MDNYAYRDNVYADRAAIGGLGQMGNNAMLAIQALRYRQAQEERQNAFEQARLDMARELQAPHIASMNAQTEQAKAATGFHNQQLAELQQQMAASQNAQNIGAGVVGVQNNPQNPELVTNLVQAQRQVPGLIPQGQFDVVAPKQDSYGPTPDQTGVGQFQGLPQGIDLSALVNMLTNTGRGGIEAIMRGTVAGNPGASADMLRVQPAYDLGGRNQWGQEVYGRPPMSSYQEGHIQQTQNDFEMRRQQEQQANVIRGIAQIINGFQQPVIPEEVPGTMLNSQINQFKQEAQGIQSQGQQPQQNMQGVIPPYMFDRAQTDAIKAISSGANPEAVKREFKIRTGKDLIMPQDLDIPRKTYSERG